MDVRPVDPRDVGWEVDAPSYRVYFWRETAPGPAPEPVVGYESSEFELTGVRDVGEVLAWAAAAATGGSPYTLYAVVELSGERGLVRLAGGDPTDPTAPP